MKTLLITILMLTGMLTTEAQESFTVTGKIGNYSAPAYIILNYKTDTDVVLDTAVLQDGQFSFSGKVPKGLKATLHLSTDGKGKFTPNDMVRFYLEKGKIIINSAEIAADAVISGTANNNLYQRFQDNMKPYPIRPDSAKAVILKQFIRENAGSPILFAGIGDYLGNRASLPTLEAVYAMLPDKARQMEEGKSIASKIYGMKNISVGKIAPEFSQTDTAGKMVSLKDFRGKYVLLDFWASWCGPCRAENPNVIKAYQTYQDKNFTVLGVSLDGPKGRDAWMAAIKKDGLPWTQVSDLKGWNNAAAVLYDIHGIPENFLLDPDGKIVARNLRGKALEEQLAKLLK